MTRKSSHATWLLAALLTLVLSGSRAFAAPIPIPVGSDLLDGVQIAFTLPSGTFLDTTDFAGVITVELAFDGLDNGEVLNIRLFHEVGGIHVPPFDIFQNIGGIFVPVTALSGPLQTLVLFIPDLDLVNPNGGFEIALWLNSGAANLTAFSATGVDVNFDEFSFITSPAAVPEPATLALLGLGLAALGFARRRQ